MTEYLNNVINPDAPWSFIPDTAENILHDLEHYTLDPVFEPYGNFIDPTPGWLCEPEATKYAGCTNIFGNFLTHSHAFRLVTDDAELISRIAAAVEKNKARPEYIAAFEAMVSKLPILTKENAKRGKVYAFSGGWIRLTSVYRITEQEANEKSLLFLDRYEGVDRNGMTHSGALHDGDQLPSTKGWAQ